MKTSTNQRSASARNTLTRVGLCCCALVAFVSAAPPTEQVPKGMEQVGIDQKLGAQLPLDAEFLDSQAQPHRLRDYFDGKTPVVLTLNYYECPLLCHLQWEDLVKTLQLSKLTPTKDFRIVTVSFDPLEQPRLAAAKKDAYVKQYGHPMADAGWNFLCGKQVSIERLTGAAGFRYRYDPNEKQFNHAATLIICSPEGKISRYLGLNTDPDVLRLSLVEASQGKTGSLFDQLFLWCYHYDPNRNSYAPVAMRIMQMGGLLTLATLSLFLSGLWMMESRRRRWLAARAAPAGPATGPTSTTQPTVHA